MGIIVDILVSLCLVIGGIFGLTGSIGLVKLQDCIQRLHAPTKAATLGVGSILLGSAIYFTAQKGAVSFHEILIAMFILLTAPLTANFIAKVYIQGNLKRQDLPQPPGKHGWAVYDEPPAQ